MESAESSPATPPSSTPGSPYDPATLSPPQSPRRYKQLPPLNPPLNPLSNPPLNPSSNPFDFGYQPHFHFGPIFRLPPRYGELNPTIYQPIHPFKHQKISNEPTASLRSPDRLYSIILKYLSRTAQINNCSLDGIPPNIQSDLFRCIREQQLLNDWNLPLFLTSELRELNLGGKHSISSKCLEEHLSKCVNLKKVIWDGNKQFKASTLKVLAESCHTNLETLSLCRCKKIAQSDSILVLCQKCTNLTSLNLDSTNVSNHLLSGLSNLQKLTSLVLDNCPDLTAKSIPFIFSCSNLTELRLANCTKFNDQSLEVLFSLSSPPIKTLVLRNLSATHAALTSLSQSPLLLTLTELDISGWPGYFSEKKCLKLFEKKPFTNLQVLRLSAARHFNQNMLQELILSVEGNLKELDLMYWESELVNLFLPTLHKFSIKCKNTQISLVAPKLQQLELREVSLSNLPQTLTELTSLKSLIIKRSGIDSECLEGLRKYGSNLTELRLIGTKITDFNLADLLPHLTNLTSLDLSYSPSLTPVAIQCVRDSLPSIQSLVVDERLADYMYKAFPNFVH